MIKASEGTMESNLYLGSWLACWGSQLKNLYLLDIQLESTKLTSISNLKISLLNNFEN